MKKKLLGILLAVAMLVAMVPMLAVGASAANANPKTVTVNTPEEIFAFLASADNVEGNIMKLGADIHYENCSITPDKVVEGYWSLGPDGKTTAATRLKASVDGNGKTVFVPDGTYQHGAILCYLSEAVTYTFKDLKVKMATDTAIAKHAEMISLFGEHGSLISKSTTFENCEFDLNFEITGTNVNACAAVLLSRHRSSKPTTITVKNCSFKMDAKVQSGAHGAILGRRWSAVAVTGMITYNIENCTFDVNYDTSAAAQDAVIQCSAVVGQLYGSDPGASSLCASFNATGTNTVVGDLPVCDIEDITFAPPATNTPGENEGGENEGGENEGGNETEAPETNAPETNAPTTEAPTTVAPAEEESGCASVVGGAAVVMIAMAAAFVCKKKED